MKLDAAESTDSRAASGRSPVLVVEGLSAGYGKRRVLADVSLDVQAGEIVTVLGHNGAGKTTLLRSVLGSVAPRAGRIWLFGDDSTRRAPHRKIAAGLSHTPAEMPLFRALDVDTNLRLGGYRRGKEGERARLERVLDMFPRLRERRAQIAGTLSGGERRMLAIGMALMNEPRLMLLDEPSIGLAPATVHQILGQVAQLCAEQGIAVLVVEQNVRAALRVASRVYYLRMGQIVLTETAEEARQREHYWEFF
jgi:branched-chain amino acid transport system ATP-binding protein